MKQKLDTIESLIYRSTDEYLTQENWAYIMDVCDFLNQGGDVKAVAVVLKKRFLCKNSNIQLYSLSLTEALVKNCGPNLHREIGSQEFVETLLKLFENSHTHSMVKERILSLIQQWANDFPVEPSFQFVRQTYDRFKSEHKYIKKEDEEDELKEREERELQLALALSLERNVEHNFQKNVEHNEKTAISVSKHPSFSSSVFKVKALYDFRTAEPGELPFRKGNIITLLEILSNVDSVENNNIIENEQFQNLYHLTLTIRSKLVKLIKKYVQKKDDILSLNERFTRAMKEYEVLMEKSMEHFSHASLYNSSTEQYYTSKYEDSGKQLLQPNISYTSTSSSVPSIHCLTQNPPTCSVCIDATYAQSKNRRRNTGAVVRIKDYSGNNKTLVIDCGKTFHEATLEYFPRYSLRRIDAFAVNGLDDLRGWTLKGLIQDYIDIYLTSETMNAISTMFPYCVYSEKATGGGDVPSFQFHIISPIHPFTIESCGNITIYPLRVQHGVFHDDQGMKLPFYIVGYRIDNLSYISDANAIPDETVNIIKGTEFLVLRTASFISFFYFTGFDHSIPHDVLEKRLAQETQDGVLKDTWIVPAYDGMRLCKFMKFPVELFLPGEKTDTIGISDLDFFVPLYVQTSCVSVLISIILGLQKSILALKRFDMEIEIEKSILIICGYKRDIFLREIMFSYTSNKHRLHENIQEKEEYKASIPNIWSYWMKGDAATGNCILAAENIDVIYVPSLRGLRAILSNYQYSSNHSSQNVLAIWPFLKTHKESGEFSAQGLSKTIALAIEASGNKNLIFCDSLPIVSPIQLFNSSMKISGISVCSAIKQITVATVFERWISAFWEIVGLDEQGKSYGIWKYHGEVWKISWKDTENGICDIEYTQLDKLY
ncbi:hypothetical protein PORY_000982 [Pneumocystis oryctolagi]|uniref:Uncharacterized protein n=1 Tax=Pneumocystis oryctolagi TaxID=42067 RepID=A0ACB7CCZ1_9ASCO|nr:hypothetical protein PORY_000982 [Pneumocystis oryctolagi]